MSSKSKLIIGLALLAVGATLIPTGFFINQYLVDQVYEGVPEALLKIQDDAIESLEDQFPGFATTDVLLGIEDEALLQLEAQLPVLTTPQVLSELKEEAISQLPAIINCSITARTINQTIDGVALLIGYPAAKDQFFNSPTFQADYGTPIQGVSDYYDTLLAGDLNITNLGYTVNAQNYSLYGNMGLPGLITDLEMGLGVCGFMQLYLNATLGVPGVNMTMQQGYNATWSQLEALAGYIKNYIWEVIVKATYTGYGFATIEEFAEVIFYTQWANGSQFIEPIDLHLFEPGVPENTTGLEAGVPNPTNITMTTCMDLWNNSNPLSFINDTGIMAWLNISYQTMIEMAFGISTPQYLLVLNWLSNFITNLTPLLIEAETGYTIPQLAQLAFYEQWANGTIQGQSILPEGFLSQLDPSLADEPYFEVGLPTASGLSLVETMNLWDEDNHYTFIHISGVFVWLEALTNATVQTLLETTFNVSSTEISTLIAWFGNFYGVRLPQILFIETGYTIPELVQYAFYEQWANGTIIGSPILADGFLSRRDPPIYGPPFFEVGLTEEPSGLTFMQCMALWNNASEYSLVTGSGINKWYNAKPGNTLYDDLKLNNGGISDAQMTMLLDWLPKFRDQIINKLAKDERDWPMEPYELGETLLLGLGAGGGALATLGVIMLILSKRT